MGAVADFVEDTVSGAVDIVGDVAEGIVDVAADAVDTVADTVGDVVKGALEDPIGTIATVAAVATQQYHLLPAISAGKVVANGGDLDDALKAAAISYAAGEVGGMAGDQVSTATNYGTELGSQQTAMLAAQDAGMGLGNTLGGAASAATGAATGALLSGGDVGQAVLGGLAGYGARLGMNLSTDALGRVVNSAGEVIADSYDELSSMMGEEYGDQPGDFPTTPEDLYAADLELGGIPSPFEGDQPGDYDTTAEEHAASEQALADMDVVPEYGDQEGDFPLNEEERALADEELAKLPAAEEYADQPGDYDTTREEHAASEEELASMPGAPGFDINTEGLLDYGKNLFKNALISNIFGSSSNSGVRTPRSLLSNLSLSSPRTGEDDIGADEEEQYSPPSQTADLELFNPTQNMSWAPMTKIGGLGAAGRYVNQEQDTYYVHPEQAKKEKELRDVGFGWDTDYGDSAQDDSYYEYKPTDFSETTFDQRFFADGGMVPGHNPQFFSEGGLGNRYVKGDGDGTSDSVPAMLASGEFVIPADVVSGLGNGDNDAGAQVLDEFMAAIRKHKRAANPKQLPEDSKGPLAYLEEALTKARK